MERRALRIRAAKPRKVGDEHMPAEGPLVREEGQPGREGTRSRIGFSSRAAAAGSHESQRSQAEKGREARAKALDPHHREVSD